MRMYSSPQIDVLEMSEHDVIRTSDQGGYDVGMDVPAAKDEDWVIGP